MTGLDRGVPHQSYPKIGTESAVDAAGPWVATEKIHGAQVVVATDGRTVRVGKRKAWLRDDEPFFGWQLLRDRLAEAARAAWPGPGAVVWVYGELYGGAYPHPRVPSAPGVSAVQTGVWYCPDVRFALFDVLLWAGGDQRPTYQPYARVCDIAAAAGLDAVPLLARGRRAEVDCVPTRFETTVPARLGLPAIPGNLAEGVVMRADSVLPVDRRPIVKRKIEEFDEVRFGKAKPFDPYASVGLEDLCEIAASLVNPARVASARSKVGEDPDAVADEVALDVLIDLTDTFAAAVAHVGINGEARVRARVLVALRQLTRP